MCSPVRQVFAFLHARGVRYANSVLTGRHSLSHSYRLGFCPVDVFPHPLCAVASSVRSQSSLVESCGCCRQHVDPAGAARDASRSWYAKEKGNMDDPAGLGGKQRVDNDVYFGVDDQSTFASHDTRYCRLSSRVISPQRICTAGPDAASLVRPSASAAMAISRTCRSTARHPGSQRARHNDVPICASPHVGTRVSGTAVDGPDSTELPAAAAAAATATITTLSNTTRPSFST